MNWALIVVKVVKGRRHKRAIVFIVLMLVLALVLALVLVLETSADGNDVRMNSFFRARFSWSEYSTWKGRMAGLTTVLA